MMSFSAARRITPHTIDSMAYDSDPPWHGLAQRIEERATARQMIAAAGLDWEVQMRPIPNVNRDSPQPRSCSSHSKLCV